MCQTVGVRERDAAVVQTGQGRTSAPSGRTIPSLLEQFQARQRWTEEARNAAHAGLRLVRRPFSATRTLPDFLIIGAQRSGTTSLYHYLASHPHVRSPFGKELQFFTLHWGRGVGWYKSHFPPSRDMTSDGVRFQTFEASPYYLYHPLAAERAARVVPDASLVALLRNPVDRAFSHYLHNVRLGFETLSFEDALAAEQERTAGEVDRLLAGRSSTSRNHQRYSYVDRGRYLPQVLTWQRHFPGQPLVLTSESLYEDSAAAFSRVLAYLDLAPWVPDEFRQYTKRPLSSTPKIAPSTRARLLEQFAEPNRQLAAHLDMDLSSWEA